jgi:archaellum component FlaG (FlaF/FlaG flagellin family)
MLLQLAESKYVISNDLGFHVSYQLLVINDPNGFNPVSRAVGLTQLIKPTGSKPLGPLLVM